jgi:hypothetical protein
MLKPDSLRAALTAAVPEIARDPDRLKLFIEKGDIATRFTDALGFEWRYRLTVELLDFTGHPDGVMLATLVWLREHQPELLQAPPAADQAIAFACDLIDQTTVDLRLELPLTESVAVVARPGGGHDCIHLPPPALPTFEPDPPGVVLEELWLGDRLLLQKPA